MGKATPSPAVGRKTSGKKVKPAKSSAAHAAAGDSRPALLSGGNPQIAKGYGERARASLHSRYARLEKRGRPPD